MAKLTALRPARRASPTFQGLNVQCSMFAALALAGFLSLMTSAQAAQPIDTWRADDLNVLGNGDLVETWSSVGGRVGNAAFGEQPILVKGATASGGSVVRFEGDRLGVSSSPVAGSAAFSIALVFRAESIGANYSTQWYGKSGIVDAEQPGVTADWGVVLDEGGRLGIGTGQSDISTYSYGIPSLVDGFFHVAVLTWGGGSQSIYIDQHAPISQSHVSTVSRNNAGFSFGGTHTDLVAQRFAGDLAEVRFYDNALNPTEVATTIQELTDVHISGTAPYVHAFSASPARIFLGDSSLLSWNVANVNSVTIQPEVGVVNLGAGSIQVSPSATTTYTLTASNLDGNAQAERTVEVDPGIPVALDQVITTIRDTSYLIQLDGSDPNGDELSFQIAADPQHGQLSGAPPAVTYQPTPGYVGKDHFDFLVHDGLNPSEPARVSIEVLPARTAPTDILLSADQVRVGTPSGMVVAQIRSIDVNLEEDHSYVLVPGGGDEALFSVVGNHLQAAPGFLVAPGQVLRFRLRTVDSAGLSFEKEITLAGVIDARSPMINEIHYNSADNTVSVEFIEIHNPSDLDVDLSLWRLRGGVDYVFPEGTSLPAHGYQVVSQDPAELWDGFGVVALGPWEGALSNEGERVTLRDRFDRRVDDVDYRTEFPWPIAANGLGASMELIHPDLDNDLGSSWRSSLVVDLPVEEPITFVSAADASWHFRKGTSEPSNPDDAWRLMGYSESADWWEGQTPVGYGDNDDATLLEDMRNGYSTLYLRHGFTVDAASVPPALLLRLYVDDGAIVWINGVEVARAHVRDGTLAYDDTSGAPDHESEWETIVLLDADRYLVPGENQLAVQVVNATLGSSDLSFDLELVTPDRDLVTARPTPGARNRSYSVETAPNIRQVHPQPQQPTSAEPIRIQAKVTDLEGVRRVELQYQIVLPGDYVPALLPLTPAELASDPYRTPSPNPDFAMGWVDLPMLDDGTQGDLVANDSLFTAEIPPQANRALVRYRILVEDLFGASRRAPFEDDPSLNFACFVYDGIPDYEGISAEDLQTLPVYHLITRAADMEDCTAYDPQDQLAQTVSSGANPARYAFNWEAAFVYQGQVYDHIHYRLRGANGRYQNGKRNFRIRFNDGRYLQARDQQGRAYSRKWSVLNTGKGQSNRETLTFGLNEVVNYHLWNLVGVPAPATHFFHFRVIDGLEETPDAYHGDFWGISWAQENYDVRFLENHGLPKGNLYKLINSVTTPLEQQRYQAPDAVKDGSDLRNIENNLTGHQPTDWLLAHVNYTNWFRYHAICEAVRNYDFWPSANKNAAWYFEPPYTPENSGLGRMMTFPWDTDSSWGPTWNEGHDVAYNGIFASSAGGGDSGSNLELQLQYRNTVRELRDLLFQTDQIEPLLDAFGNQIARFIPADLERWADNPVPGGSYRSLTSAGPALSQGLPGYVADLKKFMSVGGYWPGGTVSTGGQLVRVDQVAADSAIPARPILSYAGPGGYPVDQLTFRSSTFSDPQGSGTFGAIQWRVAEVMPEGGAIADDPEALLMEWNAAWDSGPLYVFRADMTLPPTVVIPGRTYRMRVRHQDVSGRWSHWSTPLSFVPTPVDLVSELKAGLVISEIMYHPPIMGVWDDDALEYLELFNRSEQTLDLSGLFFSDGIDFQFPLGTTLEPGACYLLARNPVALADRYPGLVVDGVYTGKLDNTGETVALSHPHAGVILSVTYGQRPPWPVTADGFGFSLTRQESSLPGYGVSLNRYGSPGTAEAAAEGEGVVINELLTSSTPPLIDAIELFNATAAEVDISGWFLSDEVADPFKYRIGENTVLSPGDYLVFDEGDFNAVPGSPASFTLSSFGEQVHLFAVDSSSNLTGYSHGVLFDGALDGVTFGRYLNSVGEEQFPPLRDRSLAAANGELRIGPVVITEIHYAPTNPADEFLELCNTTSHPIPLYDPDHTTNTWRMDGLSFSFNDPVIMPPGGLLLLVSTNAVGFRARHSIPTDVPILEVTGSLDDDGERLSVVAPDLPTTNGVPYYTVDQVRYSAATPWALLSLVKEQSLQRNHILDYGDDPLHWSAATPTPGQLAAGETLATIVQQPEPVMIRVLPDPAAVSNPVAAFSVQVESRNPPVRYQWFKGGQALGNATNELFELSPVTIADAGEYWVRVSDAVGSVDSDPVSLTPLVSPYFVQEPVDLRVAPGEVFTLSAVMEGYPSVFTLDWLSEQGTLSSETSPASISFLESVAPTVPGPYTYQLQVGNAASQGVGTLSRLAIVTVLEDDDGDGLPDEWENSNGLDTGNPNDAELDKDEDGQSNRDEYGAGTDPGDKEDALRLSLELQANFPELMFNRKPGKTYSVQFTYDPGSNVWFGLRDIVASDREEAFRIADPVWNAQRYYRVVTPRQP